MQILMVALVQLFLLIIGLLVGRAFYRSERLPSNNPTDYLRDGKQVRDGKSVVVFMGDSITHGRVGVNYVEMVESRFQDRDIEFINAGVNSELAWNLLQRVDEVVQCDPDIIAVLVGTNDANASMVRSVMNDYVKRMKLPRDPDIDWYRNSLTLIVDQLKKETNARIALISIPTIGEVPDDPAFVASSDYSAVVREVAVETDVTYLPLHERMVERLESITTSPKYPFKNYLGGIMKGIIKHYLLGKDWDDIARTSGFSLHVDYLHLNTAGAQIVADLIVEYLQSTLTRI